MDPFTGTVGFESYDYMGGWQTPSHPLEVLRDVGIHLAWRVLLFACSATILIGLTFIYSIAFRQLEVYLRPYLALLDRFIDVLVTPAQWLPAARRLPSRENLVWAKQYEATFARLFRAIRREVAALMTPIQPKERKVHQPRRPSRRSHRKEPIQSYPGSRKPDGASYVQVSKKALEYAKQNSELTRVSSPPEPICGMPRAECERNAEMCWVYEQEDDLYVKELQQRCRAALESATAKQREIDALRERRLSPPRTGLRLAKNSPRNKAPTVSRSTTMDEEISILRIRELNRQIQRRDGIIDRIEEDLRQQARDMREAHEEECWAIRAETNSQLEQKDARLRHMLKALKIARNDQTRSTVLRAEMKECDQRIRFALDKQKHAERRLQRANEHASQNEERVRAAEEAKSNMQKELEGAKSEIERLRRKCEG